MMADQRDVHDSLEAVASERTGLEARIAALQIRVAEAREEVADRREMLEAVTRLGVPPGARAAATGMVGITLNMGIQGLPMLSGPIAWLWTVPIVGVLGLAWKAARDESRLAARIDAATKLGR